MRFGFIITSSYQLFHYGRIARYLPDKTAYIEVRDKDFGLTSELVATHIPKAEIVWVSGSGLGRIDGQCDVLVCQTPVPIMHFFSKSLVAAQQYSLAKERYQYGAWRSQASLNLMYGRYSTDRVSGFAHAVPVGNPLLDSVYATGKRPRAPERAAGRLRVLYMPTYGDLSNKRAVVERLRREDIALTIKLHHAENDLAQFGGEAGVRLVRSDVDPIEVILDHDVVVSDYSGAIYDALAVRRPVLVVDELNEQSEHLRRLSDEDRSHADIVDLVCNLRRYRFVREAYEAAAEKLANDARFDRFLERYFVNLGSAGRACAEEIMRLAENGEPKTFHVLQVRDSNRRYILENRKLRAQLTLIEENMLRGKLRRARSMPLSVFAYKAIRWGLRRVPGGNAALEALRKARARLRSRNVDQRGQGLAVDRWSLPVRPIDRRIAMLRILEDALRKACVDYRTYTSDSNAYCAIRQGDLDKVCTVIRALGRDRPGLVVWLNSGPYTSEPRPAESLTLQVLAEYESVNLGVPYENGAYCVGRRGAVEIVLVEPRDVRLVAKRWLVEKTDWTEDFDAAATKTGIIARTPKRPRVHALEDEPIDIVYTWVDSADPEWQAARERCAAQRRVDLPGSSNDERFINRDELKYSLRSVWLYAPFVRHIYIVTAGHRPAWLDTDSGKVTVVPHSEIFPSMDDLPTFNSHAIESCLHRIPGLSEHFLYFNDDVFLGRETRIETFFTKAGQMKSRLSPSGFTTVTRPGDSAIPTDWASYNAVQLMLRDFGLFFDRKVKHVPMPLKRSLLEEIEHRYPREIARTRASRFRERTDISVPSMLAHYYGIATGRAVEWEGHPKEYAYADTGRKEFVSKLRAIRNDRPMFVCLNVTRHADIDFRRQAALLHEYLNEAYPFPSPYEKAPAPDEAESARTSHAFYGDAPRTTQF